VLLAFLGFNAALFAFSSLVPYVLIWGGAALLNISLLSLDLWASLARVVFFGKPPSCGVESKVWWVARWCPCSFQTHPPRTVTTRDGAG